jgi:photosystem II stability/assembly factor-like uncharacterized protein
MSNPSFTTRAVLALATPNAAICYAATDAGLWRLNTTARKSGWQHIALQFGALGLTSVAAAADTVVIGAGGDIAVSQDAAESWGLAQLPARAEIQALAISPAYADDQLVLAATARDGVLRSIDGGATFHAWNFGLLDLRINALAFSPAFGDDGTVLAAGEHAVFISRNGGRAWRELATPASAAPFTAASMPTADTLLIGTETAGLWRAALDDAAAQHDPSFKPATINALLGTLIATPSGIYEHTRGRWRQISADSRAICLARCGDLLAGTMDGGVFSIQ